MKRFIALFLAILTLAAVTGCGKKKRVPVELTLSTEDSEAILRAAGVTLPDAETAPGAGTMVQWFGWSDPYQAYSESEIVNTGFWTFKEKYNCTFDFVETTFQNNQDDLANLIMAGTPPDCMTGGTNSTASFPMKAIKGVSQAVDPYINYDDPLWSPMKSIAENFVINGKHYQICMQTKPANVVVYNRRVVGEWGFDEPAELYYNDEWTWDKFFDMCVEFSDPDADRFALDGYAWAGMFTESTGQMFLMRDPDNGYKYYSNLDSPEIERGMQYLYDLIKNSCTYAQGGWTPRDDTFGAGMKEGKCLFYVIGESFFQHPVDEVEAIWGDMHQGEIMFAPLPRDENGDGNYYISSSFEDVKGSMILINGAKNPEGAALLAACVRFKVIDPTVIAINNRMLKDTYLWTDEMLEMSDECKRIADEHIVFDASGNLPDNLQQVHSRLGDSIAHGGREPSSWAQLKEQYAETFEYYIEELNASLENPDVL